jgi:DNA-binding NarL/FixJ family response regulator
MRPALSRAVPDSPALLIVDDEQSILSLCCDLAAGCGWIANTACTTDEALRILGSIHIDCLITDIRVPSGGLELIRKVRSTFPAMKIFVLSQYGNIKTAVEAIRLGALDFLTKPFVIEDFQNVLNLCSRSRKNGRAFEQSAKMRNNFSDVPGLGVALYDSHQRCLAINDVLAGTGFPGQVKHVISQSEQGCSHDSRAEPNIQAKNRDGGSLTRRETETLRNLAEGKCNKEIAEALALSPKTIDTYRQRIMSKLDLHTQSDLIRYAIRSGLVKP